jgi:hypothetical protein
MSVVEPTTPFLDQYLSVAMDRYEACIGLSSAPTSLGDLSTSIRFHYLKLDSNGRPRWRDLAKNLADHILAYCFSASERKSVRSDIELMGFRRTARDFFRDSSRSGEAGEMLLFFLLEAVLQAPQMVSKISLKTNPEVETFGSDGVHMKWNEPDNLLEIYFGEAKLHKSLTKAVSGAVESIEKFHAKNMEDFELRLVSRHYKHAGDGTKSEVLKYVERGSATDTARINHACLLGYDWNAYDDLKADALKNMAQEFDRLYRADQQRIIELVHENFTNLTVKRLRFEVFVLPFQSVEAFRKDFLEAL